MQAKATMVIIVLMVLLFLGCTLEQAKVSSKKALDKTSERIGEATNPQKVKYAACIDGCNMMHEIITSNKTPESTLSMCAGKCSQKYFGRLN